jgi:hypothetical protein
MEFLGGLIPMDRDTLPFWAHRVSWRLRLLRRFAPRNDNVGAGLKIVFALG